MNTIIWQLHFRSMYKVSQTILNNKYYFTHHLLYFTSAKLWFHPFQRPRGKRNRLELCHSWMPPAINIITRQVIGWQASRSPADTWHTPCAPPRWPPAPGWCRACLSRLSLLPEFQFWISLYTDTRDTWHSHTLETRNFKTSSCP